MFITNVYTLFRNQIMNKKDFIKGYNSIFIACCAHKIVYIDNLSIKVNPKSE